MSRRDGLTGVTAMGRALALWIAFQAGLVTSATSVAGDADVAAKVEALHNQMWTRFVDEYGIVLDYTELNGTYPRATPEECREGKPNALAWWTATENGSMFNGTYLDAAVLRWQRSGAEADCEKIRTLTAGLLQLSRVSEVPGFIARNVATDAKTPYPMGSNDQTAPWFFGLYRALESGALTAEMKTEVLAKILQVGEALLASDWRMPCDTGAPSPYRGTFKGDGWEFAPRLLFACLLLHHLTGDEKWETLYLQYLDEKGATSGMTRLEICKRGMLFEHEKRHSWTCASGVICLRGLWELEKNEARRSAYADGLNASARLAANSLELIEEFDPGAMQAFHGDWRTLNELWQPQTSEQEAVDLAITQVKELGKVSPRRYQEFTYVREPAYAAWIVTMAPDADLRETHRSAIARVITHFDYSKLYYSQFFPLEAASYRLSPAG